MLADTYDYVLYTGGGVLTLTLGVAKPFEWLYLELLLIAKPWPRNLLY